MENKREPETTGNKMMKFENRYSRNVCTLSSEECVAVKDFRICVIGCGGLGGYVIEMLGRLGIGSITVVDGDVFDESNLNRQLLATEPLLGKGKAEVAAKRMAEVNSEIEVQAISEFLTEENARRIITGHDLVVDALDNIGSRLILEDACSLENIPLVHGAIAGWYGQVAIVMPGDYFLKKLYSGSGRGGDRSTENRGSEVEMGNPSFTPAVVAGIQVSECIKLLLHKGEPLEGKMLTIDLETHDFEVFSQ